MSWKDRAACFGDGRNWMADETRAPKLIAELRAVCEGCPVSRECLSAAMSEEAGYGRVIGVRGGLTGSERMSLQRMLKVSA